MKSQIAIILLNFNSFQDTDECLKSILKSEIKNVHVYVVDNASQDDSLEVLQKEFNENKAVTFILSKENLGFSGGCNLGIKRALREGFDYVLLLNNDTIVTKNFLLPLVKTAQQDSKIGIVGGKVLFNDDRKRVWDAGGFISRIHYHGTRRRKTNQGIDNAGEVGFVTCCMALVKKEVFETIGLLPEAYFFGSEEWEFSLRANRAGFQLMYTPDSVIYHKVGRSHDHTSAKMLYNTYRNRVLFVKRNFGKLRSFLFLNVFVLVKTIQRLLNYGQLKPFGFGQSARLLKTVYIDSLKYNSVRKPHWKPFE